MSAIPWKVLVEMTCARLSDEIGEPVANGIDVTLSLDPDGRVRYTALSEKGDRACRIALAKMLEYERGGGV